MLAKDKQKKEKIKKITHVFKRTMQSLFGLYFIGTVFTIATEENLVPDFNVIISKPDWDQGLTLAEKAQKLKDNGIDKTPDQMLSIRNQCVEEGKTNQPRKDVISYCQKFMPAYYPQTIANTISDCKQDKLPAKFKEMPFDQYLRRCISVTYYSSAEEQNEILETLTLIKSKLR